MNLDGLASNSLGRLFLSIALGLFATFSLGHLGPAYNVLRPTNPDLLKAMELRDPSIVLICLLFLSLLVGEFLITVGHYIQRSVWIFPRKTDVFHLALHSESELAQSFYASFSYRYEVAVGIIGVGWLLLCQLLSAFFIPITFASFVSLAAGGIFFVLFGIMIAGSLCTEAKDLLSPKPIPRT